MMRSTLFCSSEGTRSLDATAIKSILIFLLPNRFLTNSFAKSTSKPFSVPLSSKLNGGWESCKPMRISPACLISARELAQSAPAPSKILSRIFFIFRPLN